MAEAGVEAEAEVVVEQQPEPKEEEEVRSLMLGLLKNQPWKMRLMIELLYMRLLITQELASSML